MNTKTLSALAVLLWSLAAQAGELIGITPSELEAMQAKGALVVDVRTPEEWSKSGLIPGSAGLTYFDTNGKYDKDAWLKQLKPLQSSPEQPLILVCRSGNRSGQVGKMLANEAGYARVYHLEKGVAGWGSAGKPLEPKSQCKTC